MDAIVIGFIAGIGLMLALWALVSWVLRAWDDE